MAPEASAVDQGDLEVRKTDFVPFLSSLAPDLLLRKVIFLLVGPDLLRSRGVSRCWRDAIDELTRPGSQGHAYVRRSIAWATCNANMATLTYLPEPDLDQPANDRSCVVGPNDLVAFYWRWVWCIDPDGETSLWLDLDLRIYDRRNVDRLLFTQTFEKAADPPHVPSAFTSFHGDVLSVCWPGANLQMRFLTVCLNTYQLVRDVQRPIEDGFTHLWIEKRVLETGRSAVKEEIVRGLKAATSFHFHVDSSPNVLIIKAMSERTYDVKVYNKDLQVYLSRPLVVQWGITEVQYEHPMIVLSLRSDKSHRFFALWNVEIPGRPAALWCGPVLRSGHIKVNPICRLYSPILLYLFCEWDASKDKPGANWYIHASSSEYALFPPEKAINVLSGDTGHPPEPSGTGLKRSDLDSSTWMLQSQRGCGVINVPYAREPKSTITTITEQEEEDYEEELVADDLEDEPHSLCADLTYPIIPQSVGPWGIATMSHNFFDFWNVQANLND